MKSKNSKKTGADKRQHPRLNHVVPLKVAVGGYDFTTSTQNISCLGAYCHIDKYVPPFTKVAINMDLDIASKKKPKHYNIACKGVIVRSEDASDGGFNIAIFFNDIKGKPKEQIVNYIKELLS